MDFQDKSDQEIAEMFESAKAEVKVAREVYAHIKEMNDFEPCPEAHAEMMKSINKFNAIGTEIEARS